MHLLKIRRKFKEHWVLSLVLLIAFIHGAAYVFLIPPWQHYDEPGHFEYVWLIANREGLPGRGDYDQSMRREVAASMIEHGFFRSLGFQPNLLAQTEPVWIGIAQINDRPIYYLLVAVPLYLVRTSDITFQLYLGRLVSLGLYLITILAAYGITVELVSPDNPLRWMAPAALAMLPGFTDLMTAVNDDVGATMFFSLFLWTGARLIKLRFSWSRALFLLALAGMCFFTKNTVTIAVVLAIIPLLFSVLAGSRQWLAWILFISGVLIALGVFFTWGEAANWYRENFVGEDSRVVTSNTRLGKYAFRIPIRPSAPPPQLVQLLPPSLINQLRGKSVTLGAWIWADQPGLVRTPLLVNDTQDHYKDVEVGTSPNFFAISADLSEDVNDIRVVLSPVQTPVENNLNVYYDGLVLVPKEHLSGNPPQLNDVDGRFLKWNDQEYSNLIRNASAERAWPGLRGRIDKFLSTIIPGRPSLILASLLDWKASYGYFSSAFQHIFRTFWGKFGWGDVPLVGHKPYRILGIFSLVSLFGVGIGFWRRRQSFSWSQFLFLYLSMFIIWGLALMRGSSTILDGQVFIPVARYGYPAVIPAIFVLAFGWHHLIISGRRLGLPAWVSWAMYLGLWLVLDIIAVTSITKYYSF